MSELKKEKKEKFFGRITKFIREVRMELKKVIWPSRQQLVNNTLIVFLACLSIGAIVWIADAVLGVVFKAIFGA